MLKFVEHCVRLCGDFGNFELEQRKMAQGVFWSDAITPYPKFHLVPALTDPTLKHEQLSNQETTT